MTAARVHARGHSSNGPHGKGKTRIFRSQLQIARHRPLKLDAAVVSVVAARLPAY